VSLLQQILNLLQEIELLQVFSQQINCWFQSRDSCWFEGGNDWRVQGLCGGRIEIRVASVSSSNRREMWLAKEGPVLQQEKRKMLQLLQKEGGLGG
jgi:hypothetical protein